MIDLLQEKVQQFIRQATLNYEAALKDALIKTTGDCSTDGILVVLREQPTPPDLFEYWKEDEVCCTKLFCISRLHIQSEDTISSYSLAYPSYSIEIYEPDLYLH